MKHTTTLVLLALSFPTHADMTAENIVYLHDFISRPPYATMTPAAIILKYNKPVAHLRTYWATVHSLYEDIGPIKTQAFYNMIDIITTNAVKPPTTATSAAIIKYKLDAAILTNIWEWMKSGRGIDLGSPEIQNYFLALKLANPPSTAAITDVMNCAWITTSPKEDDFGSSTPDITLNDVTNARAIQ